MGFRAAVDERRSNGLAISSSTLAENGKGISHFGQSIDGVCVKLPYCLVAKWASAP